MPIIIKKGNLLPGRFSDSDIPLPSLTDILDVSGEPYSCYQNEKFVEDEKKQEKQEKQQEEQKKQRKTSSTRQARSSSTP